MQNSQLNTLQLLKKITDLLQKDVRVTKIVLIRKCEIPDSCADTVFAYGCDNKIITWEQGNWYSLLPSYKNRKYIIPEVAYYPLIELAIKNIWKNDKYNLSDFYIEQTAHQDSKIVGPWTRPDFTLVSYKKFPWTIGSEFDVVTFEVKRPDSCNVLAVFEALSHSTVATRAYVVFVIDEREWSENAPQQYERVKNECNRHGVGLILIENVDSPNPHTKHLIRARRKEIDHERCSNFIEAVITEIGRSKISKWK